MMVNGDSDGLSYDLSFSCFVTDLVWLPPVSSLVKSGFDVEQFFMIIVHMLLECFFYVYINCLFFIGCLNELMVIISSM